MRAHREAAVEFGEGLWDDEEVVTEDGPSPAGGCEQAGQRDVFGVSGCDRPGGCPVRAATVSGLPFPHAAQALQIVRFRRNPGTLRTSSKRLTT